MTQKEALDTIGYLKWFLDLQGLYASVKNVHGEHQVVIKKGRVYVQSNDTVGTNSRIGNQIPKGVKND